MDVDRVLVAESDPHLAEIIVIRLSNAGYQITTCTQGDEVLPRTLEFMPGVVIVDQYLPVKDGFEVCYELKLHAQTRNMGIILVTDTEINLEDMANLGVKVDRQLVKPFKPKDVLTFVNQLAAERRAITKNSLTGFQGWNEIRQEIIRQIEGTRDCDFLLLDINNFRIYNQCYGFGAGDEVIKLLSRLLVEVTDELEAPGVFIAHIHGDDFAVLLPPETGVQVAQKLIERFDEEIIHLYLDEDRERGGLMLQKPDGKIEQWPLMALAVAVVRQTGTRYTHPLEMKMVGEELLRRLKLKVGSNLLTDHPRNGTDH